MLEPGVMASQDTRLQQPRDRVTALPVAQRTSGAASAVSGAVGRQAVQAAEKNRARREIALEADLNEMEDRVAFPDFPAFSNSDESVTLSTGRMFVLRDSVWTNVAHHDSLPVVEIELYSSTYFELLRALPELERWFKTFDRVLVAGTKTSIKTVSSDAPAVEGRALERLVQEFRGR